MATAAASGLPATSGVRPEAVATAATIEPAPGSTRPPPAGYVGSALVATKRAPSRTARDARSSRSKSKLRWKPTTTASAGPSSTTSNFASSSASTTPGPAQASTRAPNASEPSSSSAAACALVRTSPGSASIPKPANFSR